MTPDALQGLLQKGFSRERWLDLLREIVPTAALYLSPQSVNTDGTRAKNITQLGEAPLAGDKTLAILEVETDPTVDLARNRAGLRHLAARFIDLDRYHGVFAAFHTPGTDDWRLTFASRESAFDETSGELAITETAPRRYTYLLGPAETCRTAAERLLGLRAHGSALSIAHITEAFSVEKLNKEFFRDFTTVFNAVAAELKERFPNWQKDEATKDFHNQEAQILLNRLLFLYFVQRKGWLHRQRDYLFAHFQKHAASPSSASYYEKFLFPVFRILATEWRGREKAPGHLAPDDPHTHDLPFLNGGLFLDEFGDEHREQSTRRRRELAISNATFERVFSGLLERYNFTIREDSPLDQEVAIDPEMLGKIFEELILREEEGEAGGKSKRHDTGSHYTPRPIVHYLCREALAAWLESRTPFAGADDSKARIAALLALDAAEGLDEAAITKLRAHLTPEDAGLLGRQLDDFRACDPAVGSGAFPIGLLHELLNLTRLAENRARGRDPAEDDRTWLYDAKKRIIHHTLYGVDIQERATEICKLRLWLSLMVDHELSANPFDCDRRSFQKALRELEPLPNLDYKIRRANSLVDSIHGHPVELRRLSGEPGANQWLQQLTAAKLTFFNATTKQEKRDIHCQIYEALAQLGRIELGRVKVEKTGLGITVSDDEARQLAELRAAEGELGRVLKIAEALRSKKTSAAQKDELLEQLHAAFADRKHPTFVWQLDFAEIFQRRRVKREGRLGIAADRTMETVNGFDVVIGNPPYVRPHHMTAELKELLWARYKTFLKKADLYCCFIEQSVALLAENGCLSFIVSNGFLRLDSFVELRKLLLRTRIRRLIDITDYVFETATVKTALLVIESRSSGDNRIGVASVPHNARFSDLPLKFVPQAAFEGTYANVLDVSFDPQTNEIKQRMIKAGIPVENAFDISFGVKTGDDEKFLSFEKTTANHKPLLRGEDIGRYTFQFKGEYVWFVPEIMRAHRQTARPGTKERYEQPKTLVRDTGEGLRASYERGDFYVKDVLVITHTSKSELLLRFLTGVLNSRALRFFYETTFPTIHVQRNELAVLPIPRAEEHQRAAIDHVVEYLLYLHRQESVRESTALYPRDPLMTEYFEQWVDAMVYELFFPEELHGAQTGALRFFDIHAAARLPRLDTLDESTRLPKLREIFEKLYEPSHPLRGALYALHSLELVRTIEGQP